MEKKPRENLKFKRVEIMKKSKFLKKSLATLLALMLVVAMIPMSAAAAESRLPDLQALTVDNNTVALEGDTFAADIAMSAER